MKCWDSIKKYWWAFFIVILLIILLSPVDIITKIFCLIGIFSFSVLYLVIKWWDSIKENRWALLIVISFIIFLFSEDINTKIYCLIGIICSIMAYYEERMDKINMRIYEQSDRFSNFVSGFDEEYKYRLSVDEINVNELKVKKNITISNRIKLETRAGEPYLVTYDDEGNENVFITLDNLEILLNKYNHSEEYLNEEDFITQQQEIREQALEELKEVYESDLFKNMDKNQKDEIVCEINKLEKELKEIDDIYEGPWL